MKWDLSQLNRANLQSTLNQQATNCHHWDGGFSGYFSIMLPGNKLILS